jgi:hypothetical protein
MVFRKFINDPLHIKFAKTYLLGTIYIGFYRGYNNHYYESVLQHKDENYNKICNKKIYKNYSKSLDDYMISPKKETDTIIDKFMYGIFSVTFYYLNPFSHLIVLYYTLRRIEKRTRNIPLIPKDWSF